MSEVERIISNINGELPEEEYGFLIVQDIPNPKHELEIFKQTMIAFLENKNLDERDPKWEELLPKQLVTFTHQLEEEDYHKDDLISHIPVMINRLKEIKDWEWYSSAMLDNDEGFEIIFTGKLNVTAQPLLHHQGIPHASIFVEKDGKLFATRALTDVLTYKTFDPVTMKLTKKSR